MRVLRGGPTRGSWHMASSWASLLATILNMYVLLPTVGAMPHPMAPAADAGYTSVQYIGFPIQTGYDGYLGSNMYYIDEEDGVGVYPGMDDIESDLAGRLAVMNRALEVSLNAQDLDKGNSTLKIFLAPEFFFRGPSGAYSAEDPALLELGDKLRSMVADTRWRDWVFVFGSVIGATKIVHPEKSNLTGGPLWDTYNFAIIQRGNSPERYTHFKRYISGIDFLSAVPDHPGAIVYPNMNLNSPDLNTTETIDNITVPVPKSKDEIRMLYSAFPSTAFPAFEKAMGTAVNGSFSMAGLDFCLDLCLDHAEGVCAAALDADKAAGGRGEVDVQLIVSAGMSIIPDNTRVPIGGSVLLCDGLGSGAQHLVSKFGDTLLGGNVHVPDVAEARAVPQAKRKQHLVADNTPEAGMLGAVNISIYGDHWRKPILGLFGAQRYQPRTQGAHHHYSSPSPPPPPAEEIEQNFLHGTPPSDWVFPPTPLPTSSCFTALTKLCSINEEGSTIDCQSCAGKHLIELVTAGCTDNSVLQFCSRT